MNKKGISFKYLIAAIIAVIVLIVMILIFKESIREPLNSWLNIIKGISGQGEEISKGIEGLA